MTRKTRTVNPQKGTLKQKTRALRSSIKSMTAKLIAFALFILVSIPNMSFVQDDAFTAAVDSRNHLKLKKMSDNSCCAVEKPGIKRKKGTVKLLIPSIEMIRKSDSEATSNLVYSLKESKIKSLKPWFVKSDVDINTHFKNETSILVSKIVNVLYADINMQNQFAAENINSDYVTYSQLADNDINNLFIAENAGIANQYVNVDLADQEINVDFSKNALTISGPSARDFSLADTEMEIHIQQVIDTQSDSVVKGGN